MSAGSSTGLPPAPSSRPPRPPRSAVAWRTIAVLGLGGSIVAGAWGWFWFRDWLPRFAAQVTADAIQRPVAVGPLESLSLTELRFGRSRLPATPNDPNEGTAEQVRVRFNIFNILTWANLWGARAVPFEVEVWRAQAKLQQLPNAMPFALRLASGPPGWIEPRLIRFRTLETSLDLQPAAQLAQRPDLGPIAPIQWRDLAATLDLDQWDKGAPRSFQLVAQGRSLAGGTFETKAGLNFVDGQVMANLKTTDLNLANLAPVLPAPIAVKTGQVSGSIEAKYQMLAGGLGRSLPELRGDLDLRSVQVQSPLLGSALATIAGPGLDEAAIPSAKLRFDGRSISLTETRLDVGPLALAIDGRIDGTGTTIDPTQPQESTIATQFDLTTRLAGVDLAKVRSLLTPRWANLPIATGQVDLAARLRGSLTAPEATLSVRSAGPVQIDRLGLKAIATEVTLGNTTTTPTRPETTTNQASAGRGVISLNNGWPIIGQATPGGRPDLRPDLRGAAGAGGPGVTWRQLSQGLGFVLPRSLTVNQLEADLATGGLVRASGSAQGQINDPPIGQINGPTGPQVQFSGLTGSLTWQGLAIGPLAQRYGLALPIDPGSLSGQIGCTGSSQRLQVEGQINGDPAKLAGQVAIRGDVQGDRLAGSAQWQGLQIDRLIQPILPATARGQIGGGSSGQASLSARLNGLALSDLAADLQTRLTIGGGSVAVAGRLQGDRWSGTADLAQLALKPFVPSGAEAALPGLANLAFVGRAGASGSIAAGFSGLAASWQGSLRDNGGEVGRITGTGTVAPGSGSIAARWQGQTRLEAIAIDRLSGRLAGARFNGQVTANGAIASRPAALAIDAAWSGTVTDGAGRLVGLTGAANLADDQWRASAQVDRAQLDRLVAGVAADLAEPLNQRLPDGQFTGQVTATGLLSNPETLAATIAGQASDRSGLVAQLSATAQRQPGDRWQAEATINPLALNRLAPQIRSGVFVGRLTAAGPIAALAAGDLGSIVAQVQGQVQQARVARSGLGEFGASLASEPGPLSAAVAADLNGGRWQVRASTQGLALQPLIAQLPGGLFSGNITAQGNLDLTPGETSLSEPRGLSPLPEILKTAEAQVSGDIADLAGGSIGLSAQLSKGQWQATADVRSLGLAAFVPQALGRLGGHLTAQGPALVNLADLARASRATFRGQVSPGPAPTLKPELAEVVNQRLPIALDAAWTGQAIALHQAKAEGLLAAGTIAAAVSDRGQATIGPVDLNVRLRDWDLGPLAAIAPAQVATLIERRGPVLAGRFSFDGKLSGPVQDLQASGQASLAGLVAAGEVFAPILRGPVSGSLARGLSIDLRGQGDRLFAAIDQRFRPSAFEVVRGQSIARGQSIGPDRLAIEATGWDLAKLNLPADLTGGFGAPRGLLSATAQVNLNQLSAGGTVTIDQPWLGTPLGDRATAAFSYGQGVLLVHNGQLREGGAEYRLDGRADLLAADPRFQGRLTVSGGRLETVTRLLRLTDFASAADWAKTLRPPGAFGKAADVEVAPIVTAGQPVWQQLRRLAEIQALLKEQVASRCQAAPLPDFDRLQGEFGGTIDLQGTVATGATANFDLNGSRWDWATEPECQNEHTSIAAERVELRGSFAGRTIQVDRFQASSGPTLVAFAGQLGENQSGTVTVKNFPADRFQEVPAILNLDPQNRLPRLAGMLNLQVALAGSVADPRARGQLELLNGQLNTTPVRRAVGSFSYDAGRLNFSSEAVVRADDEGEPIRLAGSWPQALPFAAVGPATDEIRLSAKVRDRELDLLSLLVPEFSWLGGQGQVDFQVSGTTRDPRATGSIALSEGVVSLKGLPEPIRAIGGQINLVGDRLEIPEILGTFSGGQIRLAGMLPLARRTADDDKRDPLTLNLERLALNLPDLYQGGVKGQAIVKGTALEPILSGNLALVNGRVFLPSDPGAIAGVGGLSGGGLPIDPQFNNLEISLGDGLQVLKLPVINFLAEGGLRLNGTLSDPKPTGRIRLQRGLVNLFATQFVLDRGSQQFVEFRPNSGLDPHLDVNLVAYIPEPTKNPFQTDNTLTSNPAEIRESYIADFGSARTVRVNARVQAPASQLLTSIELTSRPSRSEAQILALIGGSLANTVDDRSGGAVAIANLAGAGLLNSLQTNIANAIGLTDFRVYPTTVTVKNNRNGRDDPQTALGLGIEAGLDVTNKLSTSVTQVVSDLANTTRFNLDYRASDDLIMRGSIDPFSGDTRMSVQYETRF